MPGMPDLSQLQRVAFRAESTGRIKDLSGHARGQSIPDYSAVAAGKFLARIAAGDVQADLDRTFQALRDAYNLKRKQIEASRDEDGGMIRTPQFTYTVTTDVDPENGTNVIWRREVSGLSDPLLVRAAEFKAVFGPIFTTLLFEFARPINVADLVDHLEDEDPTGLKLTYGSDTSWCELTIKGFPGTMRVDAKTLVIAGPPTVSTASLLDQFLAFLDHLPRQPDLPALR